jgi:hypothetical protein
MGTKYLGNGPSLDNDILTKSYVDTQISTHNHDSDYLQLTGGTLTGTLTTRSILPDADSTYNIGSDINRFAHIYADDIHVGANSLYVNDKKVISDVSDTIVISTDTDQNMNIETSGVGHLTLTSETGSLLLASNNSIELNSKSGSIISVPSTLNSKNINIENESSGGNISISALGTMGNINLFATDDIWIDSDVDIDGSLDVLNDLTVNTVSVVLDDDSRLSDARTPLSHDHIISDVTGLQTALDNKSDDTHNHDSDYLQLTGGTITGDLIISNSNLNVDGIAKGGFPLVPNMIYNSYMSILTDSGVPVGFSVFNGDASYLSIEATSPLDKAFEGRYVSTEYYNANLSEFVSSVNDATGPDASYWFGHYNKGPRISRGGMYDGWHYVGDGHILKITNNPLVSWVGYDDGANHCAVTMTFDYNSLGAKWLFTCWVKMISGDSFGVGSDAGYRAKPNPPNSVSKEDIQAATDGWYRYSAIVSTSQITSLDNLAMSLGFIPESDGSIEAYLALPYLQNLTWEGTNLDSWTGSFSDHLYRNGFLIDPTNRTVKISNTVRSGTTANERLEVEGNAKITGDLIVNDYIQIGEDGVNANRELKMWAENGYEAKLVTFETPTHGMGLRYNSTDNILYIDRYPNTTTPTPLAEFYRDSDLVNFVSATLNHNGNAIATQTWVNSNYLGIAATAVDSDKLDNQDGTYYLNWNNFTNTPTTLAGYGITDAASDTELSNHASDTTAIHGITDTSDLALKSGNVNQFSDITSTGSEIEDAVSKKHNQNTDVGTSSSTFYIGSSGPKIKNNSGVIEVRNNADTDYANLVVENLTVKGTTTTIESETITINDNILVLNNNYSGSTPTENGGLEIERGTLTNSTIIWDESNDLWKAGLSGSEKTIVREDNEIALTGDVTGTATFDSNGNLSLTTTVADDSHNHIISNVDGLQTALDNKSDDTHNHDSDYLGITDKASDSEKLDNLDSTQFLRSDTDDTMTGVLTIDKAGDAIVISGDTTLDGQDAQIRMGNGSFDWNIKYVGSTTGTAGNELRFESTSTGIYLQLDHDGNLEYYDGASSYDLYTTKDFNISDYSLTTHNHTVSEITDFDPTTKSDVGHNHAISDVTNLQTELDGKSDDTHNHSLDSLSNTTITSNTSGELLLWNGTSWINQTLAEAGISADDHNHSGIYEPVFSKNTAFNKNFGTVADTVCEGNDSRLSDARIPTSHGNEAHDLDFITASAVTYENLSANGDIGTGSAQVAQGDHNHDSDYLQLSGGTLTGNLSINKSLAVIDSGASSTNVLSLQSMGTVEVVIDHNNNDTDKLFAIKSNGQTNDPIAKVDETGNFTAAGHVSIDNGSARMEYDSTNECIKFVFA